MSHVDPEGLDNLIEDAGIGRLTAGKLRRVNRAKQASTEGGSTPVAGHGAPHQAVIEVESL